MGIPSGPVTGPVLLDVELLDDSPEFALLDPVDDATGIEVGGSVEFIDAIVNKTNYDLCFFCCNWTE